MPAGTDLVTWNPRKGDTGDDRYSLPDGEIVFTTGGRTQEVSTPPTLDDVNAGYGWWQILLELARRKPIYRHRFYPYINFDLPEYGWPLRRSYASNRTGPQRYSIQEMRLDVEYIRAIDSYSQDDYSAVPTYSWQDSYPSGRPMPVTRTMIFDFRKALATDRITVYADNDYWQDAEGNYPTLDQRSNSDGTGWETPAFMANPYGCGMLNGYGGDGRWHRIRQYRRYTIPSWIPELGSAQMAFRTWDTKIGNIYKAPYMSIVPANWNTLGTLETTWSGTVSKPKTVDIAIPAAGEKMTYILTSPNEISGTKVEDYQRCDGELGIGETFTIQLRLYTAVPPEE